MAESTDQARKADGGLDARARADAAWSRMLAGNARFAEDKAEHPWQDLDTRRALLDGQHPDAVVLSCSDSRVPPEIVFDEGLGDLFTIRTAGEMVDSAVIETLEYAVNSLGVCLIVVLGHQGCGAIKSALHAIEDEEARGLTPEEEIAREVVDGNAPSLLMEQVGASIRMAKEADLTETKDFEQVHVSRVLEMLVDKSEVIQKAVFEGRVSLVGARYHLDDGKVEVLSF